MSNVATLTQNPSFGSGVSADATIAAAITVATGITATTATFGLPTVGNGALFNTDSPIACAVASQADLTGASNSGLPASVGISSVTLSGTTITVSFVTNAAANVNIPANSRFTFTQQVGD